MKGSASHSGTPPPGRLSMQRDFVRPQPLDLDTSSAVRVKELLAGKTVQFLLGLQKEMRERQAEKESSGASAKGDRKKLSITRSLRNLFARSDSGGKAPTHLIEISSTETVGRGFALLKEAHVSSIPVTTEVVDGPVSIEARKRILDEVENFLTRPIKEVIDFLGKEKRVELPKFPSNTPLDVLAQVFQSGTHKALVESEKDNELHILGQIDLTRFLYENAHCIPEIRDIPVERIMHQGVVSIGHRERALDGFVLMHKFHLSAIAVVDEEGKVAATLGVRDLRGLDKEKLSFLNFPIGFFLHQLHGGHTPRCVRKTESILDVVRQIYENHWFENGTLPGLMR
eukprot:tig00021123_g18514.t1